MELESREAIEALKRWKIFTWLLGGSEKRWGRKV